MKTVLLSFSYEWYGYLKNGLKVYEHRKRFCNEPVLAYVYLGLPYRIIAAKMTLGKPVSIRDWKEKYKYDDKAIERIDDCLTRNNVAMPILSFQEIEDIDIRQIESVFPDFRVPISYLYLDNKPEIYEYIKRHEKNIGEPITHSFDNISSNQICVY